MEEQLSSHIRPGSKPGASAPTIRHLSGTCRSFGNEKSSPRLAVAASLLMSGRLDSNQQPPKPHSAAQLHDFGVIPYQSSHLRFLLFTTNTAFFKICSTFCCNLLQRHSSSLPAQARGISCRQPSGAVWCRKVRWKSDAKSRERGLCGPRQNDRGPVRPRPGRLFRDPHAQSLGSLLTR
jgi:hypothetical protein